MIFERWYISKGDRVKSHFDRKTDSLVIRGVLPYVFREKVMCAW